MTPAFGGRFAGVSVNPGEPQKTPKRPLEARYYAGFLFIMVHRRVKRYTATLGVTVG